MRPHRWNPGFEWQDHREPPRFLTPEQVRRYDELGFFVLEDAFTEEELGPVLEELDRYDAKVERWLDRQGLERVSIAEKGAITFAPNLTARSEVLAAFVRHPVYVGIACDLLGPDVNLYWEQAVYKKPEKPRRFPWHQDTGYKVTVPQDYLTCWTAITDATLDNGCPVVAPGIHRQGTLHHDFIDPLGWECFSEPPVDTMTAPVRAGGIVVFSSLTPHLTGPNTTDGVRKAYIVQYAVAGTVGMEGDPETTEPTPVPQDDPTFQFPVLRDGKAVAA